MGKTGPGVTFSSSEKEWILCTAYLLLEQNKPAPAAAMLRLLNRLAPEFETARNCHALAELECGRPKQAEALARESLEGEPDANRRSAVQLILARALWDQGRQDEAREQLRALVAKDPPSINGQ